MFALDKRALAVFRIGFMAFWILEFCVDRVWSVVGAGASGVAGAGLYGIRSENLAPAGWVRKNFPTYSSVFTDYPDSRAHMVFVVIMLGLALSLLVGSTGRTPVALALCVFDRHWISRNPMAADEHTLLMNRMLLIIAFTPVDDIYSVRVREKTALCTQPNKKPMPADDGFNEPVNKKETMPSHHASVHHYDNSFSSMLLVTSIVMLWAQVGVEKMIDFDHWFVKANAVQYSLVNNHCLPLGAMLVWFQSELMPVWVAQLICRITLLIEFPVGPLSLIWPSDFCRNLGLCITGFALLLFGTTMAVDWFPFSVFVIQLAMIPASAMDKIEQSVESLLKTINRSGQGKSYCSDFNTLASISVSTQPSVNPNFPTCIRRACLHLTSLFLGLCVFAQVFCGIRCFLDHRGVYSVHMISTYWDWRIVQFGSTLPLQSGWSVASPPPKGLAYWTLVGIPFANTTWHNPNGMGIFVRFHRDQWSADTETTPIMDVFWEVPPNIECSGFRQFLVSEEKYFHNVLSPYPSPWNVVDLEVPRQLILKQACRDFHSRYPSDGHRLQRVELWYNFISVENPWLKQLSKPHPTFVAAVDCDRDEQGGQGDGKLYL